MRAGRRSLLPGVFLVLAGALPALAELQAPSRGDTEWRFRTMLGSVDPSSKVNVRENSIAGEDIGFRELGMDTAYIPAIDVTHWFSDRNAIAVQTRYFVVRGSGQLDRPKKFNGTVLAANTDLHADTSKWYSLAVYFERRFVPKNPSWDWRALAGLEYTAINFTIDGGHAALDPTSTGQETKEGFDVQELPIPTFGVELRRLIGSAVVEWSLKGNWINEWNSLRSEGGTIYLSQWGVETHLLARFRNAHRVRPFAGLFYYAYEQHEKSNEDDNLIRWSTYGPEIGLDARF